MVCSFDGVDQAGIYLCNRRQRRLDLVCHYGFTDEILAGMMVFDRDSWQVHEVLEGVAAFNYLRRIPLQEKIFYEQRNIHALALIPLMHRGQVVGSMNLASCREEFVNGFEQIVLKELAVRISRIVAIHLAQVKLHEANEESGCHLTNLSEWLQLVGRPAEPEALTGFCSRMKDELDVLNTAISLATEKVMQKLKDGLRNRELPFLQKKVDMILNDIEGIVQITGRLRVFCNSLSAIPVLDMLQSSDNGNELFLHSMVDFRHALEMLDMNGNKKVTSSAAMITSHFKPLNNPVRLRDLNFRIDRLTPN
jgi:hypothetical protein